MNIARCVLRTNQRSANDNNDVGNDDDDYDYDDDDNKRQWC